MVVKKILENQQMANKFYQEGVALAKSGQLIDAIKAWETTLNYTSLIEFRGGTFYNIGLAYEKMGDTESALSYYRKSIDANPQQFNSLCNIGSIYIRQNKPEEALNYLLAAAKINPNDEITKINIGICYDALGK